MSALSRFFDRLHAETDAAALAAGWTVTRTGWGGRSYGWTAPPPPAPAPAAAAPARCPEHSEIGCCGHLTPAQILTLIAELDSFRACAASAMTALAVMRMERDDARNRLAEAHAGAGA